MARRIVTWSVFILIVLTAILAGLVWSLYPPALPVPPQTDRLISGVTILNPGTPLRRDQTIVIREGRIDSIRDRLPSDDEPLCPDCIAMPGLIDAHVHNPPSLAPGNQRLFALLYLAYGVTTVRDVGQVDESITRMANRLNAGSIVGPRMMRCGTILEGDPPAWPSAIIVRTAQDGRQAVERLADQGVDCIKVYNEVGPDAFDAITNAAMARNLPLIGHVPHKVGLSRVANFEAQHLTGIPYLTRPRPPVGTDFRTEDILALLDRELDAALRIIKDRNVIFTPTIANFTQRLTVSDPVRFPPTDGTRYLPDAWATVWRFLVGHPDTPYAIARQVEAAPLVRRIVGRMKDAGIDVLAGTDTLMPYVVPGEAMHLEIAALADAFGDREDALAAATTVNGRHIGSGEIGVLAPGARADILLLSNNPVMDLEHLRDWQFVIADGRLYDRATMDVWLKRYESHFHGPVYSAILNSLVKMLEEQYAHSHGGPH